MVKSRRKLLVMVPAWLPCLKMTDISRELYKVSRFVAAFLLLIVFFTRFVPNSALQIFVNSQFKVI